MKEKIIFMKLKFKKIFVIKDLIISIVDIWNNFLSFLNFRFIDLKVKNIRGRMKSNYYHTLLATHTNINRLDPFVKQVFNIQDNKRFLFYFGKFKKKCSLFHLDWARFVADFAK